MVNAVTDFIPELWSKRIQKLREKMLVAKAICSFEEQAGLSYGDTVHRPTVSDFVVDDYVRWVAATAQDITSGDETLLINKSKVVSFYVDELDNVQSKYDIEMERVKRATYQIKDDMDMMRFRETINATLYADAAQNGGSDWTAATLIPSTTVAFFENAKALLRTANVEDDRPRYLAVTPKVCSIIAQTFVWAWFNLADSALKNGYKGDAFGLKVYESTNILHSRIFTGSTLINGNTFVVAGVTFTFATTASSAWNVDLGSSDTNACDNAVLAINGTGTPWATTYIDISAANRAKLKAAGVRASAAAGVLTIYGAGAFTSTWYATTFVAGTLTAHCEMWRMGTVDMVVQMNPLVQKNKEPKMSGYTWNIFDLYGLKTFTEWAVRMLDLRIVA